MLPGQNLTKNVSAHHYLFVMQSEFVSFQSLINKP